MLILEKNENNSEIVKFNISSDNNKEFVKKLEKLKSQKLFKSKKLLKNRKLAKNNIIGEFNFLTSNTKTIFNYL